MLRIDWSEVFVWESQDGSLLFEVFVGSQYGMADITKALITEYTFLKIPPVSVKDVCFVVVHGIAPSGIYNTKRQLIEL